MATLRTSTSLLPRVVATALTCAALGGGGCDAEAPPEEEPVDLGQMLVDGKGDLVGNSEIHTLPPNAEVVGAYDSNGMILGYIVELGAGAEVTAQVELGGDGDDLATIMSVNAGFKSAASPGTMVDATGDGAVSFTADDAGRYLVAFTTFDDAEDAPFRLSLTCEGSESQCGQLPEGDCKAGTLALQRIHVESDTTWAHCDVRLLQHATVAKGATLSIGSDVRVTAYNVAGLTVHGTLDVSGTEDAPVTMSPAPQHGSWGGLELLGDGSRVEHAVLRDAPVALRIGSHADGLVSDTEVMRTTATQGTGILIEASSTFVFERAVVHGYATGIRILDANDVRIEDSVIRDNRVGLDVTGGNTNRDGVCQAPTSTPAVRDPVIVHTDIIDNDQVGIRTRGDAVLLQLDRTNVLRNGDWGVEVLGPRMFDNSFIRQSNLADNGEPGGPQVRSFHRDGANGLHLDSNFYGAFNDLGELSDRFVAACGGFFDIDGVSLDRLPDAGPRLELLKPEIRKHCENAE